VCSSLVEEFIIFAMTEKIGLFKFFVVGNLKCSTTHAHEDGQLAESRVNFRQVCQTKNSRFEFVWLTSGLIHFLRCEVICVAFIQICVETTQFFVISR
jgi:hypothetical protein